MVCRKRTKIKKNIIAKVILIRKGIEITDQKKFVTITLDWKKEVFVVYITILGI